MRKIQISATRALLCIASVSAGIGLFEWRALYALDHPAPHKISCVSCHSDVRTLKAIADKSNDSLYLVHSGDLSANDLKRLTAAPVSATGWAQK